MGVLPDTSSFNLLNNGSILIPGIQENPLTIKAFTSDSIAFGDVDSINTIWVFKRVKPQKVLADFELIGKAFYIQGNNYSDSLEFIDDSIYMSISRPFKHGLNPYRWRTYSYSALKFLIFERPMTPPFIITSSGSHGFTFSVIDSKTWEYKATEIKGKEEIDITLTGNWIATWAISNDSLPKPPPPPGWDQDHNLRLSFDNDSLEFEMYGNTRKIRWKSNATKSLIYFPNHVDSHDEFWEILEVSEERLLINRIRGGYKPEIIRSEFIKLNN